MIREDDLFEINEAKQTPGLGDQFPSQELVFDFNPHSGRLFESKLMIFSAVQSRRLSLAALRVGGLQAVGRLC